MKPVNSNFYELRKIIEKNIDYIELSSRFMVEKPIRILKDFTNSNEILDKIFEELDSNVNKSCDSLRTANRIMNELAANIFTEHLPDRFKIIWDLLYWRMNWDKRDTDYKPKQVSSYKIYSAKDAVKLIPDKSVVISSGFGATGRCSIFFWALREVFMKYGRPKELTWITVSAQGGRGKAPGTIEELAIPGLIAKYISGHMETAKAILDMADRELIELHTLPQGEMTFLLEAQGKGNNTIESKIGIGTFLDPRVGTGSKVTKNCKENLIGISGEKLAYTLPKINVALVSVPYADEEGNLYFENAASITEVKEALRAAKKNNGKTLVAVSEIVPKNKYNISIESDYCDIIVVNPDNEQIGGVAQKKFWKMFTENSTEDVEASLSTVQLINTVMGITPSRREIDSLIVGHATEILLKETKKGAIVNLGVGLPDEVGKLLYETGKHKDLTFTTESGVYGGIPLPGIFFGASINPEKILSSAEMFHIYESKLDVAVLGFLQVDSNGNVNVSRRGGDNSEFVGPGGFCNITSGAKTIIFIGSWMVKGKVAYIDGKVQILKYGNPKFVEQVREITFNGNEALKSGKKIYYISEVGIFQLTERGLELIFIEPGIDPDKDILSVSGAKIIMDSCQAN